jgi:putative transposase
MPTSTWPDHIDPEQVFFITCSARQRAQVFRRAVIKRILVDALNTARILGQIELFAFVIMPNHVHMIVHCTGKFTVADVVREFKRETANLILRQYEAEGNQKVLDFVASTVRPGEGKTHAVWESDNRAENIPTQELLRLKLDYIHLKPVQPNWHLASSPEQYPWSSARFYLAGGGALIPLTDARECLA